MIYREKTDYINIVPQTGRLMALDVGTKRIGIAICESSQKIVSPYLILQRRSNNDDFTTLLSIIQENDIKALIIGIPIHESEQNFMLNFIENFAKNLQVFLNHEKLSKNLPLILFDESLSSFSARYNKTRNIKKTKNTH